VKVHVFKGPKGKVATRWCIRCAQ